MTRYFDIARLREGVSIEIDGATVRVNLDRVAPEDHITNDKAFRAAQASGVYFYLSGGGSVLINERYLAVVKRDDAALVNPGKYSLFTGRAEGPPEWQNPRAVVRELFEELRIEQDGKPVLFAQTPLSMGNTRLVVCHEGVKHITEGFLHIAANGDMNLLFLFAVEVPRRGLVIRDAEGNRPVFLLDIKTMELETVSGDALGKCTKDQMTPHLAAFAEVVRLSS